MREPVKPTITPRDAARVAWDAVVVGAGPAGSMAARELARRGARVLLVDKAPFPRAKVCGCCLGAAALATLERAGLGSLVGRLGGVPLRRAVIAAGRVRTTVALPAGAVVSREAFDAGLVADAAARGAAFMPRVAAEFAGSRRVKLRFAGGEAVVTARAVLVADGLSGRFLGPESGVEARVDRAARIGCGTIVDDAPDDYAPGVVHMHRGRGGYVGVARLEDGRVDVAAAFDPRFVRASGSPGMAAAAVLRCCGAAVIKGIEDATWKGTPLLTRRRAPLQRGPMFITGDAAGYVEPFTGEGIAWALAGGLAVVPFVLDAMNAPDADMEHDVWTGVHARLLRARHRSCRAIAAGLRSGLVTRAALAAMNAMPRLGARLARRAVLGRGGGGITP